MNPFRRSRPAVDPPVVRAACADCHTPEHPGVLNRLDGRLVCVRCYRVSLRARAAA